MSRRVLFGLPTIEGLPGCRLPGLLCECIVCLPINIMQIAW